MGGFLVPQTLSINLVVILILAATTHATSPSNNLKIAKPSCSDRCGNVSIPFPFGTAEGCYLNNDYNFFVNCSQTGVALWANSSIEITNISLSAGQLTVMQYIARDCYDQNGTLTPDSIIPWISTGRFTVSNAANKFVVVGCDTFGFVKGQRDDGRGYQTGCTPSCVDESDVEKGSCTGLGCCMTSIPRNIWQVNITLGSYDNYTYVSSFDQCGYAFVVQETSFTFFPEMITSLRNVAMLPMVIDWAFGDHEFINCSEATKAKSSVSYGCKSANSYCYDPDNGLGYRCNCTQGYQGNPYLDGGCRDIDECKDAGLNICIDLEHCENKNGSFICVCPKGYDGDGKREGKGCHPIASKSKSETPVFKLAAGISFGIIVLLLSACWLYFVHQNRRLIKMRQHYFHQNGGMLLQEKLHGSERSPDLAKIYSEYELKKATKNFHNSMIIGEGGFGTVYKGFLHGDGVVAIKKAKQVPKQIDQFTNEVIVLSKIKHKNVVKLLGCCLETEVPLLVYEFVSNGTLTQHVHNKAKARLLSWETRLGIAQEVASVLSYLHSDAASTPIIHRDVKCANILLDHSFTAKVADFGASRLVPLDPSEQSTMVQGTFGYLDPEYMQTNQLNEKSDVYSFGVVLVELLTGMIALDYNRPEEERNLANLFVMKQNCLFEILEENVVREGNEEDVKKVCVLARSCLKVSGEDRPSMKEVAMELEGVRVEGKKHSWIRTEYVEEDKEYLLCKSLDDDSINGGGNSSIVGFDSVRDNIILPVDGGR